MKEVRGGTVKGVEEDGGKVRRGEAKKMFFKKKRWRWIAEQANERQAGSM